MLWIAIAIGLVLNLLFADIIGLIAGGIVVPGYIAIFYNEPLRLLFTLVVAFLSLYTLKIISSYAIIYGRRRLVLVLLLGFIYGYFIRAITYFTVWGPAYDITPIGFIIGGLIAYWMERQGILETICTMIITATFIRLILVLINGGKPIVVAL